MLFLAACFPMFWDLANVAFIQQSVLIGNKANLPFHDSQSLRAMLSHHFFGVADNIIFISFHCLLPLGKNASRTMIDSLFFDTSSHLNSAQYRVTAQ